MMAKLNGPENLLGICSSICGVVGTVNGWESDCRHKKKSATLAVFRPHIPRGNLTEPTPGSSIYSGGKLEKRTKKKIQVEKAEKRGALYANPICNSWAH